MDSVLLAGVLAALATVLAAWITVRQRSRKRSDLRLQAYRSLEKELYQVRLHNAHIRSLLSNDPGPNFATEVVGAAKSFRDACDKVQSYVGANRSLISKECFQSAVNFVDAASELIASLNRGTGGTIPADQVAADLTERGNLFQQRLRHIEELVVKDLSKL